MADPAVSKGDKVCMPAVIGVCFLLGAPILWAIISGIRPAHNPAVIDKKLADLEAREQRLQAKRAAKEAAKTSEQRALEASARAAREEALRRDQAEQQARLRAQRLQALELFEELDKHMASTRIGASDMVEMLTRDGYFRRRDAGLSESRIGSRSALANVNRTLKRIPDGAKGTVAGDLVEAVLQSKYYCEAALEAADGWIRYFKELDQEDLDRARGKVAQAGQYMRAYRAIEQRVRASLGIRETQGVNSFRMDEQGRIIRK